MGLFPFYVGRKVVYSGVVLHQVFRHCVNLKPERIWGEDPKSSYLTGTA